MHLPPVKLFPVLHRGTRSTFGSLLPMGSIDKERNTSVITVTLLVEDHLGTTAIALKRYRICATPTASFLCEI